jgi:hypothetical protein
MPVGYNVISWNNSCPPLLPPYPQVFFSMHIVSDSREAEMNKTEILLTPLIVFKKCTFK